MMLGDLERGSYRAACESFSLRSRVGITIAAAMDGSQSSGPCADVATVAGALNQLGLASAAQALRREAGRAGLAKMTYVSDQEVHLMFRGIAHESLAPVVEHLTTRAGSASYRGEVIAVREGSHWALEVVRTRVTVAQLAHEQSRSCSRRANRQVLGPKLCALFKAVYAGEVLDGAEYREFSRLFARSLELPSRSLKAFRRAYGDGKPPAP